MARTANGDIMTDPPTPDINERTKKSFDMAADASKQLITLATGIVALTITFSKDFVRGLSTDERVWVGRAWVAFFLSVIFGVWSLLALTGSMGTRKRSRGYPTIFRPNATVPAFLQIIAFLVGMGITIWVGYKAVP
jgi:hypothetical protein